MSEGYLYLKNKVEGMNRDELILFVYQEMVKVMSKAESCFDTKDIEGRVTAINKGIEIISVLNSILDFDKGGDISVKLRSLYLYSINKLSQANYKKNKKIVSEVKDIFKDLYTAWSGKMKKDIAKGTVTEIPDNRAGGGLEIYG